MTANTLRWMLLIDSCGAGGGVGVAELSGGARMVAERALPGRETQERLMSAIAEALDEAGISVGHLQAIAVVHGPGSFTGVRIGVAAAKGLAQALEIPVFAVSRLAVLAAQGGTGAVLALLDAGRGDVFAGLYRSGEREWEALLALENAITRSAGAEVVAQEAAVAARVPHAVLVSAVGVQEALPLAAAAVAGGQIDDVALLDANYLRVPDAEVAMRAAQVTSQ